MKFGKVIRITTKRKLHKVWIDSDDGEYSFETKNGERYRGREVYFMPGDRREATNVEIAKYTRNELMEWFYTLHARDTLARALGEPSPRPKALGEPSPRPAFNRLIRGFIEGYKLGSQI